MVRRPKVTIKLYSWELDSMPEYSASLPTGQTLWKMWSCNTNAFAVEVRCKCGMVGRAARHLLPAKVHCSKCGKLGLELITLPDHWVVGQYIPDPNPEMIGMRWFDVLLREGPKPRLYEAPDWTEHAALEEGPRAREKQ